MAKHSRSYIVLFTALIALQTVLTAQPYEPQLEWDLVNPFRFITEQSAIDEIKAQFKLLKSKDAYHLERALQALADKRVSERIAVAWNKYPCATTKKTSELKECFETYSGWFADLAKDDYANTCWDGKRRKYRNNGKCEDYIFPKSHRIRVWLENPLPGDSFRWYFDKKPIAEIPSLNSRDCSVEDRTGVCVELDISFSRTDQQYHRVTLEYPGVQTFETEDFVVKDKLIVGLGDSYAAGEGNPDIPASFTTQRKERDRLAVHGNYVAPRKDKGSKAVWLDRRCHRSMYSYQFQTALLLAMKNPKEAVTFVSFSCTGGTTRDIIDANQSAKEGWFRKGKVPAQLPELRTLLNGNVQGPRPIDYLLLSTGGNDAGFGKYVAYVLLKDDVQRDLKFLKKRIFLEPGPATAEQVKQVLIGPTDEKGNGANYLKLQNVLFDKEKGITFNKKSLNEDIKRRVILTTYPPLLNTGTKELCKGDPEFFLPFGNDANRARRIADVDKLVYRPLKEIQNVDLRGLQFGWTIVSSHHDDYSRHGFCVGTNLSNLPHIPFYDGAIWKPANPRDYRPYETRPRWIKVPVDSKLTVDSTLRFLFWDIDYGLEDDWGSIIHPTSEGLARTADANIEAIENLELQRN